jgi:hypothetical protein
LATIAAYAAGSSWRSLQGAQRVVGRGGFHIVERTFAQFAIARFRSEHRRHSGEPRIEQLPCGLVAHQTHRCRPQRQQRVDIVVVVPHRLRAGARAAQFDAALAQQAAACHRW